MRNKFYIFLFIFVCDGLDAAVSCHYLPVLKNIISNVSKPSVKALFLKDCSDEALNRAFTKLREANQVIINPHTIRDELEKAFMQRVNASIVLYGCFPKESHIFESDQLSNEIKNAAVWLLQYSRNKATQEDSTLILLTFS